MRQSILVLTSVIACTICSQSAVAQFGNRDWISMWALNGRTESQVIDQFKSEQEMTIKTMKRVCDLDESQIRKLDIAAGGDIKRFQRDIQRCRAELKEKKLDDVNDRNNDNIQAAWNIVSPLATKVQNGVFGEGSLFSKVSVSALDQKQRKTYEAELERIRLRRWRTMTRVNLSAIEASMPMRVDQRKKLLDILDAEALDPEKVDKNMDAYVGFLKLASTEIKPLGEFLDEHQIDVLKKYRDRYKGWAR